MTTRTMEILAKYKDASLAELLIQLIAEQDGVAPETVTEQYVLKQLQERVYPSARLNIGSKYGGYDGTGLTFRTREELTKMVEQSETKLTKFRAVAK